MSIYEWVSSIGALIAIIISLVSLSKASKANKEAATANGLSQEANILAKEANAVAKAGNSLSQGNIELYINERITETRNSVRDVAQQMIPLKAKTKLSAEEKKQLEGYKHLLDEAIESNLNAYDEACAKYIDKKVDQDRFKSNYHDEIKQLVDDATFARYFDPVRTRYRRILTVYEDWFNLEKKMNKNNN